MWVDPLNLISAHRLDVFARTDFVLRRLRGQSDNWPRTLYRALLVANQVDGSELENSSKATMRDYLHSFERVIDSMQTNGFQQKLGTVPIRDGVIVNGAHRLATALVVNSQVYVSASDEVMPCYDFRWMRKRGLASLFIDAMAMNLIRMSASARAIVVFGESDLIVDLIEREIRIASEVVIRKKIYLTEIGKRRLVDLAYSHNDWWDTGLLLERMTSERFSDSPPHCHIIFTLESNLETLQQRKESLRTLLPPNHFERRLHGTDHYFDTVFLAEVALNENSRRFLNSSPIGSERRIFDLLGGPIRQQAPQITHQEWCIDGSAVLEIFGLRDAADIDYLVTTSENLPLLMERFGHNHVKEYCHGYLDPIEIISDPRNHLIYKGFKFISLAAQLMHKFTLQDSKAATDIDLIVSATNIDRGLYRSLDLRVPGLMSRLAQRFIERTDRFLRRLPVGVETRIRSMISRIRLCFNSLRGR